MPAMAAVTPDKRAELATYFEGRPEIVFAFLYGSHARGTATKLSDVDVAVYFRPLTGTLDYQSDTEYSTEYEVWAGLERILKTDVELLVLNRASPNVAASALRGVALSIKDWGLYVDFMLYSTLEAEEYREETLRDFMREQT